MFRRTLFVLALLLILAPALGAAPDRHEPGKLRTLFDDALDEVLGHVFGRDSVSASLDPNGLTALEEPDECVNAIRTSSPDGVSASCGEPTPVEKSTK